MNFNTLGKHLRLLFYLTWSLWYHRPPHLCRSQTFILYIVLHLQLRLKSLQLISSLQMRIFNWYPKRWIWETYCINVESGALAFQTCCHYLIKYGLGQVTSLWISSYKIRGLDQIILKMPQYMTYFWKIYLCSNFFSVSTKSSLCVVV